MNFHLYMALISLSITLGLFLIYRVYKHYVTTIAQKTVFKPKIVLHSLENSMNKGDILFSYETTAPIKLKFEIQDQNFAVLLTLIDKEIEDGAYTYSFNSKQLTNGVYFYCLQGGGQRIVKKFIVAN